MTEDLRTHYIPEGSETWLLPCMPPEITAWTASIRPLDVNCPHCMDRMRADGFIFPGDRNKDLSVPPMRPDPNIMGNDEGIKKDLEQAKAAAQRELDTPPNPGVYSKKTNKRPPNYE